MLETFLTESFMRGIALIVGLILLGTFGILAWIMSVKYLADKMEKREQRKKNKGNHSFNVDKK